MKLKTCKTIEEIQEEFDKFSIFPKYWEPEEIALLLEEIKKLNKKIGELEGQIESQAMRR